MALTQSLKGGTTLAATGSDLNSEIIITTPKEYLPDVMLQQVEDKYHRKLVSKDETIIKSNETKDKPVLNKSPISRDEKIQDSDTSILKRKYRSLID